MPPKPHSIDNYLESIPQPFRAEMQRIRSAVHTLLPNAAECISYAMPAFRYNRRILLYFAAWKEHCAIYPSGASTVDRLGEDYTPFRTGRGTLQYTLHSPMPDALLHRLILARAEDIDNGRD